MALPRRSGRLHPAFAIGGALLLHALLLGLARRGAPHQTLVPSLHEDAVEIDLARENAPPPITTSSAEPSQPGSVQPEVARRVLPRAEPGPAPELEATPVAPPGSAAPEPLAEAPPARRPIDLGLDGSVTRGLLLHPPPPGERQAQPRPSVGLLNEALDARDAARGMARSSQAIQAAYRAAALAPPESSAIFDVRADARGNVISVTLVSFGSNEARWTKVAGALRQQLKKSRLRVPPGAGGLLARLRIERGALANDVADIDRLERGVAIGQDSLGPKDQREETTRGLEPGRISPAAGVSSRGAPHPTRVVLLSERAL